MTAMMVTLIGMSALQVIRVQRRSARSGARSTQAHYNAQSAIEMGFVMITQDPAWRTNLGSGDWFTDKSIGTGTMSLNATIQDQSDSDPDNDLVVLIGTGVEGQATHKMQVIAHADRGGMLVEPGSWMRNAN
jgi:Tfp pilus assembly protein PilX